MKKLALLLISILILTGCTNEDKEATTDELKKTQLEDGNKQNELKLLEKEVKDLSDQNKILLEQNNKLNSQLQTNEETISTLSNKLKEYDYWTLDKALITDLGYNYDNSILMFSIYDSGPMSGVYLYDVKTLDLRQLNEYMDVHCQWSPYSNLLLVSEGTDIRQQASIYSVDEGKILKEFTYSANIFWLNENELLFGTLNDEIIFDPDVHEPFTGNITKYNIQTDEYSHILKGTKEYSYYLSELESKPIIYKQFISQEREVLNLADIQEGKLVIKSPPNKANGDIVELKEQLKKLSGYYDTLNKSYDQLTTDIAATNQVLIYKDKALKIDQSEEEVLELIGFPQEEDIKLNGTDIWYFENNYTKISTYGDLEIGYIGDEQGKNYVVAYVTASTNSVTTLRNIRIGDTLDSLLAAYPLISRASWITDREVYMWYVKEFYGDIQFTIVDGVITEIHISRSYT